ncbi:unnamed protein product [Heterosigma akashiwo]|mmetsp:Transcript_9139/g.19673  ORF Transcript_9139/g.19673 Transcript_9139/m.19673 type:complete len:341 (+) Transcript_9139:104-1126(+)
MAPHDKKSVTIEESKVDEAPTVSPVAGRKRPRLLSKTHDDLLQEDVRIYEYTSAANPEVPRIPVKALAPELHQTGSTRIIPLNLSEDLGVSYPATSQNLLASFLRICANEDLTTEAIATSQAFYVIRGRGSTMSEFDPITWKEGDLFVLPATTQEAVHKASEDSAIYWISDEPLLNYLGVAPTTKKFKPTLYTKERMHAEVETLRSDETAQHRNRLGILLGNKVTENGTMTLTHVLWSLLNVIPARVNQRPHRHNSVALDLCVAAPPSGGVYTLMGPELDDRGWVKDPVRMDWRAGGVFTTPPGWWHSHHNETDEEAWVLPVQDAGLLTQQGVLDIQFSK